MIYLPACTRSFISALIIFALSTILINAQAADQALLDVLLENGVIDHKQYEVLSQKSFIQYQDLMSEDEVTNKQVSDHIDSKIERAVAERIDAEVPLKISHGKKAFVLKPEMVIGRLIYSGEHSFVIPTHPLVIPGSCQILTMKTNLPWKHGV